MVDTPAPPDAPEAAATSRNRLGPAVALAFSGAVAAVWIAVAARAAGHGFDTTDEGFYLLTYRWWDTDHRNFTGAAYVYGPVFAVFGHDIALLRIFRLLTVVVVHLVFGWSFMRWLRPRRPAAPPTRLWEAAGATAVLAAGGAVYGWLPQTPGYNDVVLLGALLGLAAVFAAAGRVDRGRRVPWWQPAALGVVAVPVLLAKWAALPVLLLVAAAAVVALAPHRLRGIGRALAWALGGVLASAAVVHVAVVPLTVALPLLVEVNRLLAGSSMSMPVLLDRYWTYSLPTFETVVRQYGLLLVAGVVAVAGRRPMLRALAWPLGAAGLGLAGWSAVRDGGLGGGAVNVLQFVAPLLAVMVYALVTGAAGRLDDARGRLLLGALAVLPVVYAFGTGNIPLKVSANAFAAWMAVLVAVLTGLQRTAGAARALTAAVAAAALVATASIATGGLWRHPYRGVPADRARATVEGAPALAALRLDPATARGYGDLYARLRPWIEPEGRAIMGFDKMAGIVLLLGGRTVGEAWYASNDRSRTAAGITAECTRPRPWWGDRTPVLIFDRPVYLTDRALLRRCGYDIGTTHRLLAPAEETAGLSVYVPAR
jgi:hypothetical protein